MNNLFFSYKKSKTTCFTDQIKLFQSIKQVVLLCNFRKNCFWEYT